VSRDDPNKRWKLKHTGENVVKQETKIDTPKNLEARITAALTSTEITSTDLEILLQETANAVSNATIKVERERALDLTKSPDALATHRAMTESEFIRGRLRLALPELQQKLEVARERVEAAQWEQEFLRVQTIRDEAAERFAKVPKLIDELIELFRENEAVEKECSRINGSAPAGEHRRLVAAELKARGLDAFSRTNPPMAKGTTLPNYEQSEVMLWPPKSSFFPFAAPQDIRHTADWHRASTEQRRLNDERIDRELADLEIAKREFYRGH
jgi:hypothetical protein